MASCAGALEPVTPATAAADVECQHRLAMET